MSISSGSALSGFSLDAAELTKSVITSIRVALGVSGAVALIIGLLITFQPQAAAATIAILLGIYFLFAGLTYLGIGIFSRGVSGGTRALNIILGVLFLIGAALAFGNVSGTVAFLAVFLGLMIGILWIVEGVASLMQLGDTPSRGWTVIFAIISIIAGIALLFAPVWGAQLLFLLAGIALIVLGVVQIIRAFTFGRGVVAAV